MFGPDLIELDAHKREQRLVATTLKVLGLEEHTVAIRGNHANYTGESPRLSFLGFRAEFDNFPIYLAYENLFKLTKQVSCSPGRMLTQPAESIAAQRFADCLADAKHEVGNRPVGMIFPFDRVREGLIMHNADLGSLRDPGTCRLHWSEGAESRYVERYYAVLRWLKHCPWEPTALMQQLRLEEVSPYMLMRAIRDSAALRVMVLFAHIANPTSCRPAELKSLGAKLVRPGGCRWLSIKQSQIAAATGLSVDRVKRAVATLCQQGYLLTQKDGRLNLYRIAENLPDKLALTEELHGNHA